MRSFYITSNDQQSDEHQVGVYVSERDLWPYARVFITWGIRRARAAWVHYTGSKNEEMSRARLDTKTTFTY